MLIAISTLYTDYQRDSMESTYSASLEHYQEYQETAMSVERVNQHGPRALSLYLPSLQLSNFPMFFLLLGYLLTR